MGKKKHRRPPAGKRRSKLPLLLAGIAGAVLVYAFVAPDPGGQASPSRPKPATNAPIRTVPPYHPSAEAAMPFPLTLAPERFANAFVRRAYEIAREIPGNLAQQPCYCYCDQYGHGSLLDCYRSDHGAG